MNKATFRERVLGYLSSAGGGYTAEFLEDTEHGKYIAQCESENEDPIQFVCNAIGNGITVRFGNKFQHCAMVK